MNGFSLKKTALLGWALAKARFRQRIAGSYLGILWYVLEPAAFFLILLFLQADLGAAAIPRYPAYLLLGLIMLNFFIGATGASVGAIRSNKSLLQSVNVAPEALPLSIVIQFCFSHFFEFVLALAVFAFFGDLSWDVVWYPLVFLVYTVFVLGCSFILATVGVFVEDLGNIWSVASRLLWLGTPVFYVLAPGTLLAVANSFNPLYYFLSIARGAAIYGIAPSPVVIAAAAIGSAGILAFGLALFIGCKRRFAEFI